ncbi:MAG: Succinate-semialdehyde dehydrogenase [NADP(+)] [Alphaproteobacteria bacterium MarineAlpha2_Bin1]|nr:MAG: Succinate-semialdehyde dehydrogenase [NADP(+)] [Alphaproteobacteria bacterium MarineAlpha2_Bin1]|tara:strand:+ start:1003 stop:2430 length:1428 start_codon:yes stop_codon:yes gene_type:complete
MLINGKWKKNLTNNVYNTYNPSNQNNLGDIQNSSKQDILEAIEVAYFAFKDWSQRSPYDRSKLLYKAWENMLKKQESLATIMTLEQGKTLKSAKAEVKYASDFLLWYAEEAKRINGKFITSEKNGQRFITQKIPVGVVGAITPWNYPVSMITRKLAPALAAGCTVVLKPSEYTPLCAIETFKILQETGFPDGVINLITPYKPQDTGNIFTSDPRVAKVTFTGSTNVGRLLASKSGKNLKRISLELGGHAPFIIFPDADPVHAAKGLSALKFLNSGQACISPNRIFVHQGIKEFFEKTLLERVKKIKVGNGLDETIKMGPLINEEAIIKIDSQVKDALNKGAELIFGGKVLNSNSLTQGYFYSPTIISNIKPNMKIYREETFGPIAPIIYYNDPEEAINMANDTEYGLAAYIYTKDISLAMKTMEKLNFAIIGINDVNPTSSAVPFGGIANSGIGREGGQEGIEEYLETKSIGINI